jgi:hypothetical protein
MPLKNNQIYVYKVISIWNTYKYEMRARAEKLFAYVSL